MKKTVTMLIVLVLVSGLLFATGQAEDSENKSLRIMWWGSQNRHERTIEVLEMYQSEAPDVAMTYEFAGWGDYWTKVTTMAAGRNLPDIMQQDYAFLTEWQSRGLLQPLDAYVDSGDLDFSDVSDASLAGGRIDGRLYGVNLGINSLAMLIDVDMFEEAGIPVPSDDWTWKEFEEIVMTLHEELDVYGYGSALLNEHIWKSLYLGAGGWVFNDLGTDLGYSDDQILIDHIKMVVRLQEAGAIPHITREASDYAYGDNLEIQPIITGDAAMTFIWSNQMTAAWTAAGGPEERNFSLVMLPRLDNRQPTQYVKPSQFFAVTRDSGNPEEAARFISYFTNSLEANRVLLAERGVPVAGKVRSDLGSQVDRPQQVVFEYMSRVAEDSAPVPPPDPRGYTDLIQNVYHPLIRDGVRYGQYSPEEAVALFRERAGEILTAAQ